MKEFGEITNQLSVFRAKKGYSQAEVAKRIGVSRQTIISLEKNKYSPSLKVVFDYRNYDSSLRAYFYLQENLLTTNRRQKAEGAILSAFNYLYFQYFMTFKLFS